MFTSAKQKYLNMNLDLFYFLQSFQIYLCHYGFVDWMLVYYCKTEVTVIKFCKKGKKGKGRYLVLQSFNISSLFTVQCWGGVGEALWKMIPKKKKIHQLRIWSPPLKLYLNNMFRFLPQTIPHHFSNNPPLSSFLSN